MKRSQCVEGHRCGEALADLLEQVVAAEQVGAARDQVLLKLQQLTTATQEHL